MRNAVAASLVALTLGAVSSCKHDAPDAPKPHQWTDCQGSSQAFVRRTILTVAGRRPWGQAEVNVYADIHDGLVAAGADEKTARTVVMQMVAQDPAYRDRWRDFFLDALHVLRSPFVRTNTWDTVQTSNCFPAANADRDGSLAAWVRDNPPTSTNPPLSAFRLGDLFTSAVALDDVSPMYRTELLRMMNFALPGANVAPDVLEKSRRLDFGAQFSAVFLHRDTKCLLCHNSEQSRTFDPDPLKNRAWMVPGAFEKAVFGSSAAQEDPLTFWSVFRRQGVADGGGVAPWGWNGDCGVLNSPSQLDPLGIDAHFATIGAGSDGSIASVWNVEASLHRGIDKVAIRGLERGPDGAIPDPDVALAYLVAMNVAESVWREVVGTSLTIANYFPRTEAQRDTLQALTDVLVASHFSLTKLLGAIVVHPAYNPAAATAGCGEQAYEIPRLYNPWSNAETDPSERPNGVGDAVHPLSTRLVRRALHDAMGWEPATAFPYSTTGQAADASIGLYVSPAQPGFRGLDFQARLSWEAIYGSCQPNYPESDDPNAPGYPKGTNDFVAHLAASGGTLEEAVVALKDRLMGEPSLDAAERDVVESLAGAPLSSTSDLEPALRRVCGAFLASPQFLLGGAMPADTRDVPALTPAEHGSDAVCADAASRAASLGIPFAVTCAGGKAAVARP